MKISQLIHGRVLKMKFTNLHIGKQSTKKIDIQESMNNKIYTVYLDDGTLSTFEDSRCQFGFTLCTCVLHSPDSPDSR